MSNLITQNFLEDSQEWFDGLTGNEQYEVVAEDTENYFLEEEISMNNEDIFEWFDKMPSHEQNDIILQAYIKAKKVKVE